ncbi:RdRP-domain-containing protein [Trametes elegans]|nr:RdRP-domain-containing protein [Trametes elegans]
MEINVADLNYNATKWEVKRAFAKALHAKPFFNPDAHKARRINFEVVFRKPGPGSMANNGTAVLIIPDRTLADRFLRWAILRENRILVQGRKVWLSKSNKRPFEWQVQALNRTPYIDPAADEEREARLSRIGRIDIILDAIQFGVYFLHPGDSAMANRMFSNEYEIRREDTFSGRLCLDYDRKLLRIEMGDPVTEYYSDHIVLNLSNIKKLGYGSNAAGQYYACFELHCPPRFERQQMYRTYTGERKKDNKGYRERLPYLNKAHRCIAQYAYQVRVVLNDPKGKDDLKALCAEAGLRPPVRVPIEVRNCGFFRPQTMEVVREWILGFEWPVAFQLDALIRNGLLHTGDLYELRPDVEEMHAADPDFAANVLRHFSEKLQSKQRGETVRECFQKTLVDAQTVEDSLAAEAVPVFQGKGTLKCYHVIVTPTRVVLEGPYDTQSNRVVRMYHDYRINFVRVEFRDENRMSIRWPKDVNGRRLIEQRFGAVLKEGLEIAGRLFRFLGYSNSGLREHTTWFMSDFEHPEEGLVTPDKIRSDLGDFTKVSRIPAKYAARIAQAFSGTDPSVRIRRDQWDRIEDLGEEPYWHTDGQGTISPGLRDEIWEVLVKAQPDKAKLKLKPSAGIVVVDETLDGACMRLRPTMDKFEAHDDSEAEIEIAKAFIYPGTARLCRPLIMVLEDLGVRREAFLNLQDKAKVAVVTASDSMEETILLLRKHDLGKSFGLRWILQHLQRAGMHMAHEHENPVMDNEFILRLVRYAQSHILREIKHEGRIAIPEAYQLVGVADEGPAYEKAGFENVFSLKQGQIFACVQQPDSAECEYIEGEVSISRSPHIHPGDVQRVRAIGRPPGDKLCFFRNLRNVVVLPSAGDRSLASCLAGGDVDGDEFLVIKDQTLLPTSCTEPASYEGVEPRRLDRPSTIDDICDFFVEYMQSDVVGLVADQHLLAQLCSQAVDYPKNGVPVDTEKMPQPLLHAKPDWKKAEDNDPRSSDYYESVRALGALFRNIEVTPVNPPKESYPNGPSAASICEKPLSDSISQVLKPSINRYLGRCINVDQEVEALEPLFRYYAEELRYICLTHALSDHSDVRLSEEEVAIGTILAKCTQPRWRKDRMHRMRVHASQLVQHVTRWRLRAPVDKDAPEDEVVGALRRGWLAWDYGMRNRAVFGARSFGLIALGVICDMLERLGQLEDGEESESGNTH